MAESLKLDTHKFNATMRKFGAPDSVIRQYDHWTVLLRPAQVTLGSLILAANDKALTFAELSQESFLELKRVSNDLETALKSAFSYDKLNYLMLMMVDPDVHFHVIPRYAAEREFSEINFVDSGWPGPPDLGYNNSTDDNLKAAILAKLQDNWL